MSTTTKLPDKLSDLIDVALVDLEACEADPRYKIDMGKWHQPNGQCAVCLAGAVMAKTLGVSPYDDRSPAGLADPRTAYRLGALDAARRGWLWDAMSYLNIDVKDCGFPPTTEIMPYAIDPTAFKADMRRLAATLREHGL